MKKTGLVTLSSLESDQCLAIMESMHAKKFLGRKIFITSVIPASPTKNQTSADGSTSQISSNSSGNLVIHDSNSGESLPTISSPVLDPKASLAASKIIGRNNHEDFEFSSPLKFSKNDTERDQDLEEMYQLPGKRKASNSPESKELSKKEKKAAKKDLRTKSKNELKAKSQLDVFPLKM